MSLRSRLARAVALQVLTLVPLAALLTVVYRWIPGFWLLGDKRNQYLPVFRDIGRRLLSGELPVLDPSLGPSGNYAIDVQYGLYDPTHWLLDVLLAQGGNLDLEAFLLSAVYLLLLASGVAVLSRALGVPLLWSAVAGIAAACSGYTFFFCAPAWVPGLIASAWLPWVWRCLVARPGVGSLLGTAITTFLVIAGGWPSTWLALAALALGFVLEAVLRRVPWRQTAARVLALAAGGSLALIGIVPAVRAAAYTVRQMGTSNDFTQVPNFADLLGFASPVLRGDVLLGTGATGYEAPVFGVAWFAMPLLWLVPWREALHPTTRETGWRRAGVVTAAVALGLMLLLTQLPTVSGPLRVPIRQLAGAQFFFCLAAVMVLSRHRLRVTAPRVWGAVLSLAAVLLLTWSREPFQQHRTLALVALVVFTGLVLVTARRRRLLPGLVMLSVVVLQVGTVASYHQDISTDAGADPPLRGLMQLTVPEQPALQLTPGATDLQQRVVRAEQGVGVAFSGLSRDHRASPGYSSVSQKAYYDRFCVTIALGYTCRESPTLYFAREPVTGRPWIDLLGYRTAVVFRARGTQFRELAGRTWRVAARTENFVKLSPTDPPPPSRGRVTAVVGRAQVQAVRLTNTDQQYEVSSSAGARLVFSSLYWPGYVATVNSHPLPVTPLGSMLVSVRLPPGTHGRLDVQYVPVPEPVLVALVLAAVAALAGAVILTRRGRHVRAAEHVADGDALA